MANETKTTNLRGKEEKIRMCLDLLILVLAIGALVTSVNSNGGFSFKSKAIFSDIKMNVMPISDQVLKK